MCTCYGEETCLFGHDDFFCIIHVKLDDIVSEAYFALTDFLFVLLMRGVFKSQIYVTVDWFMYLCSSISVYFMCFEAIIRCTNILCVWN
jgi:hypothetical protein